MKKALAIALAVVMMLGCLSTGVFAASTASDSGNALTVSLATEVSGGDISVKVTLTPAEGNVLQAMNLKLQYDTEKVTWDQENENSKIGKKTYGVRLENEGEQLTDKPNVNNGTALSKPAILMSVSGDAEDGFTDDSTPIVAIFYFKAKADVLINGAEAAFTLLTGGLDNGDAVFGCNMIKDTANVSVTNLTETSLSTTAEIAGKTVTGITLTAPTKVAYSYGETLALAGMKVTATFEDNSTAEITDGFTCSPADGAALKVSDTKVTVTYKGKTAEQAITVAPKALTVTGLTATNRAYDGTTAVALTGGALSGALTGDTVTATMPTAGTIADANVGTGKAVTFTAIALTGADAANYTVTQPTVTVDITKATLTAADFDLPTLTDPVYNGQPQTVAAPTLKSGKTGAGAVTVKYGGSTTAPTDYGTYAITFDVAEGTNYEAATGLAIGSMRITKTQATVTTAPTAKTLTYDGTEQALITAGAANTAMEYSETQDGTYNAAIPAKTDAGTYEVWYRAAASSNYDASTATKLTVTIAKATPTVTAPTGKTDLAYSGSNQALIEAGSTTGGTLQYSIDGTTYSATVPSAKDAKNYTVSYKVVGNDNYNDVAAKIVTATIIPKALTVTTLTATNRAYDGTTAVALTGGSLTGIEGSDTVTATMPTTGTIADANVGTGKAVTFTAIALTGADAANYTVIQPTVTVDITKATLTAADFDLPTLTDPEYNGQPQTVAAPTLKSGKTGAGAVTVKYGGSTTAPTAYGTYAITFDVAEGTNYEAATGLAIGSMSITKTKAKVTTAPTVKTLTYDGTEQALITAGAADTAMEYSETQDGTYAATIPAKTDAGTYEVWYRAAADDNHAVSVAQKLTIEIAKKTVTVTGITAEGKVYDGETTATLTTSGAQFEGIVSGDTLTVAAATGAFADANAGEDKTVNITGIELGGASKDNYQLSATTATATATITKKTINPQVQIGGWTYGETAKTPVLTGNTGNGAVTYQYKVKNAADDTYTATVPTDANTYTLKATIAATTNTSAGEATADFTIAKATNPAVIPMDTVKVKVGGTRDLKALITDNKGGAIMLSAVTLPTGAALTDGVLTAGDATGTFTVNVAIAENDNYMAKTGSFSVEITEKEPQDISYAETTVEKTYGDAAFTNPLTKTKVEGDITYASSNAEVATVDETTGEVTILKGGETTITAKAAETNDYAEQTASYVLKVEKKQVTVKAIDRTIYVNGTVPDLSAPAKNTDYQVLGLIGDDELDLSTPITMAYKKDGAAADPDNTKTGTYAIIIAGGAVPDANKYKAEIEYVDATLSITYPPAPEPTQTETTETGSVTTSAEVKDGEAKATVDEKAVTDALKDAEDADALTVKVDTKDADSVEAGLSADAVKAAAEADVDLHVETENGTIKLDNDVIKDAAESGKDVAVTVKQNSNGTITFDVTAGGESVDTSVKVELPATKSNEVLKIVKEDGTEEVVKKSISEDGVVYAEIPAGATVRVEEVDSEFDDVHDDDWFAEEVDFVADRGIFNGMTETEFEPETNMSRAMLATVLYRLEDAEATGTNPFDDVADGQWFTDGVVWAADAGIVQGTGEGFEPDENISREQIAAMLHRYVQYLGLDIGGSADLSAYTDGDQVSDWAKDDMAWAVSVGLFQGNGDGTLNPTGDATRAEVAALIQRLVALIVK